MNSCNCNQGAGVIPGPCIPRNCGKSNENLRIKTVVLQPSLGTDAEGQPYAPKLNAYTNTIVQYQANGALYLYDSRGIYTKVTSDATAVGLAAEIANRTEADEALQTAIEQLQNKETQDVENLQTNINQLTNKEAEDVENLQTNINTEVANRTTAIDTLTGTVETLHTAITDENTRAYNAEQALGTRIDEIVNSPDVRYIVDSYADLEAIDKSTVGNQDYARVLQDETHDDASTYYQFSTATQEWTYIGQTGPYYTKEQIDAMIGTAITQLEAI